MPRSPFQTAVSAVTALVLTQVLYYACSEAYRIRMYAINEYGRLIHEFDPYFNYRATVYLYENGWKAFSEWFDYLVWYPLGRPVGTTIYPGMQVTSVLLKEFLLQDWSINDICVFVPVWFGVVATLAVGWLTYECTRPGATYQSVLSPVLGWMYRPAAQTLLRLLKRATGSTWGLAPQSPSWITSAASAVAACVWMALVPAHLLRSVGGGYDNEAIAMSAMVLTFAAWTRALRDGVPLWTTTVWGVVTGLAYFYMVAAWGGYVFVVNMVGLHAAFLVAIGRYTPKLHRAYTAFFVVGTLLATRVPVVRWTPLKSLEQMGPLAAFVGLQLWHYCERQRRPNSTMLQMWMLRVKVFCAAALIGGVVIYALAPTGYFGPISSRVRGLFVKHTKTGNPLVDSVAEHQPASPQAYFQYLNIVLYLAPVGLATTVAFFWNDASSFLLVYGVTAYFFSHKMVRLILLTAPIASTLAGILVGRFFGWAVGSLLEEPALPEPAKPSKSKKNGKAKENGASKTAPSGPPTVVRTIRLAVAGAALYFGRPHFQSFYSFAHELAGHISHPTIVQKATTHTGESVIVDDYRQAYFWLKDNTPEDARIMAWWDYGYQITGIANRTTIADGNTWNHEHIALLGRTLTAPEKEAHRIARHLADYLLVWAGGGGDDLAKSPHLRRIANSVYRGLCSEPTCREFGMYQNRAPTPDMADSLLYKAVANGIQPGVELDRNRFKEVFSSRYGKVRIYKILSVSKESKEWVTNPENRICDAPGSWFCRGQYPPALQKILKEKKDFKQLEDFNAKDKEDDSEYQRAYFDNLNNKKARQGPPPTKPEDVGEPMKIEVLSPEDVEVINEEWVNDEATTMVWQLISENRVNELLDAIRRSPELAHIRSEDGRGPMWWAHEYGHKSIVQLLRNLGVSEERTDGSGMRPLDVSKLR